MAKTNKSVSRPQPLKNSWRLFQQAVSLLWQNRKLFGTILAVYGLLYVVLVRGFGGTGSTAGTTTNGSVVSSFGNLLSNSGQASGQSNAAYQTVLLIVVSLVLIWALRQVYGTQKTVKAKDAFYQSTGPLIPFILVVLVISLELIPLALGASLYSAVVANGLAVSVAEQVIWIVIFFLLANWSVYLLSGSVLALYIVTLPGTKPVAALKDARKLVRQRRWTVLRKLIMLPVILIVLGLVLLLPFLLWLTALTSFVFFLFGVLSLAVVHSYLYCLYRELL